MFNFQGRINRLTFFWQSLVIGITQIINVTVMSSFQKSLLPDAASIALLITLVSIAISIFVIVFSFSLYIRRWHDLGQSGWMTLLLLIPLVNIFVWLYLVFKAGVAGKNNYGSPQK